MKRLPMGTTPSPQRYKRITGRKLQATRLRIWSSDPTCQKCKRLTQYPDGFELDHVTPLHKGGDNTDENLQVLCPTCHEAKSCEEAGATFRVPIGEDGWPIER